MPQSGFDYIDQIANRPCPFCGEPFTSTDRGHRETLQVQHQGHSLYILELLLDHADGWQIARDLLSWLEWIHGKMEERPRLKYFVLPDDNTKPPVAKPEA